MKPNPPAFRSKRKAVFAGISEHKSCRLVRLVKVYGVATCRDRPIISYATPFARGCGRILKPRPQRRV